MMLSRFAENAFWLGRYMERAESIARLLSVTESFAADQDGEEAWAPIQSVFADEEHFKSKEKPVTPLNVAKFYLTDKTNPTSAIFAAIMAKENARTLRHVLSTESWRQLTLFVDSFTALQRSRIPISRLNDICWQITDGCYAFRGVMDATSFRDEVWRFYRLGSAIERADQVTRLVDIKYYRYDCDDDKKVAPPDVAWWNTLLRSASGYHAFQRRHSFNADPTVAAEFLLLDRQLGFSVVNAAILAQRQLVKLETEFDARPGTEVFKAANALMERLENPPGPLSGRRLHRYLDQIQRDLITLANALYDRYFAPTQ